MRIQRGFLIYDTVLDEYKVDYLATLSILVNELLLELLLHARPYMTGRLLDVGCGKRPYALIYEPLVKYSVGTEVSWSPHGTDAADLICLAEQLPFAAGMFDTILCTEVLEHTSDPFQVMKELSRLLRPGGHLILSVPFIYPIHDAPYDHWRFTAHGLVKLCQETGLELISLNSKGGVIVTMLVLVHNIFVRAVNSFSKQLRLDPPLYYRPGVRWLLCLPQWFYLHGSRWLRGSMLAQGIADVILPRLRPLSNQMRTIGEINQWLTCGYLIIARKPSEVRTQ